MNREVNPNRHAALIRYLLDQSEERERAAIEEGLLADVDFQEDLKVAEEDLADRYASGRLTAPERELVAVKFQGSPEWKARTEAARAMNCVAAELAQAAADAAPALRKSPVWRWRPALRMAPLAVATAVALIGVWLLFRPGDGQRRGPQVAKGPSQVLPSFLLAPELRKGGAPQTENAVRLPSPKAWIELRLPLGQNLYPVYQVKLHSLASGATTLLGSVAPSGRELRVPVDGADLQPGSYTLVLQAAEADGIMTEVAGYSFRVER